jgi:hypothetical protein
VTTEQSQKLGKEDIELSDYYINIKHMYLFLTYRGEMKRGGYKTHVSIFNIQG